jgi:prepilin-type N-terminal cleavage/methylation domain-containing protein
VRSPETGLAAAPAFTLLELIIVMAVLTVMMAIAAPSLSSSLRAHNLEQAGAQLLALTEYGRDEAISQGIPMDVWLNPANGQYGVNAKAGFPGDATRDKRYTLATDLHFDTTAAAVPSGHQLNAAEFEPDGTLDPSSNAVMRIVDRTGAGVSVTQTADGFGYEVRKETR